jgi:uncharacterized membrane protein (DUF4010 family)
VRGLTASTSIPMPFFAAPEARVALALALGLLIGLERERRNAKASSRGFAGVRTFGLVGLLGGLFAYTQSAPLVVAGAVIVGLAALTAYVVNREDPDRGMTTEIAMLVTYALGALALRNPTLCAAGAVTVASLLALRSPLHHWVGEVLSDDDLRDGLVFLVFALVVLPVAPDVRVGPYGAINPQSLARLVVVLMFVQGVGNIARRAIGPRYGLAVAGFVGGFVSSSATIAAFGLRAREAPGDWRAAATGALASSVATIVLYALMVAAVDPGLAAELSPELGLAGLAAVLPIALLAARTKVRDILPVTGLRSFRVGAALSVALVFSVVGVVSAFFQQRVGGAGTVAVSAVAALLDAHSTAASVASLHHVAKLDTATAELAIVVALTANTLTKVVLAWTGRHVKYAVTVGLGAVLIAGAAWIGTLV